MRVDRRIGGEVRGSVDEMGLWPLGQSVGEILEPWWGADHGWDNRQESVPNSNLVLAVTGFALNQFLKLLTSLHNICPIEKLVLHETSHGSEQVSMTVFGMPWGFYSSPMLTRVKRPSDDVICSPSLHTPKTKNLWTMWKAHTRISQWQRRPGKTSLEGKIKNIVFAQVLMKPSLSTTATLISPVSGSCTTGLAKKVPTGFSIWWYRKTWANLLANPIHIV